MLDRMRPHGYTIELNEAEQEHFNLPGGWLAVLDNDDVPCASPHEANARLESMRIERNLKRRTEK